MDVREHEAVDEYEAPRVVDYGDLFELTQGMRDGDHLDADFPQARPEAISASPKPYRQKPVAALRLS
jgi:hypothetical protein